MEKLLLLIQGRKTTIFAVLQAIIVYLLANGLLQPNLAELLTTIMVLLAGGANYGTKRIMQKKNGGQ